jgi:hypothetical protein
LPLFDAKRTPPHHKRVSEIHLRETQATKLEAAGRESEKQALCHRNIFLVHHRVVSNGVVFGRFMTL